MGIFAAIVASLAPLLGQSGLTDGLHSLFSALHKEADIPTLDAAMTTAQAALAAGATVTSAIDQVVSTHTIPAHHAAVVVAAAHAANTVAGSKP